MDEHTTNPETNHQAEQDLARTEEGITRQQTTNDELGSPTVAVRYGYMNSIGEFRHRQTESELMPGTPVIIQTHRGIEIGEVVCHTCSAAYLTVPHEQVHSYVDLSGKEYFTFENGRILRIATNEDLADWQHIKAETAAKTQFCQERADKHKLEMKVLQGEHLFGGERIVFYFMAEGRVDFRALVKGLAEEFQTRIEMRQIGARDEARLLADFETCGRECCCKNFLKTLKPISMRMAKMQKATLDPAKVSGRCGRLKCCLRYEHATYEEFDDQLPRMGARVVAERGSGKVIARQIISQTVQIQTEDGGRMSVRAAEILDEAAQAKMLAEAKEKKAAQVMSASANASVEVTKAGEGAESGSGRSRSRRSRRKKRPGADGNKRKPSKERSNADANPAAPANVKPNTRKPSEEGNKTGTQKRRRRRKPRRPPGDRKGPANSNREDDGKA